MALCGLDTCLQAKAQWTYSCDTSHASQLLTAEQVAARAQASLEEGIRIANTRRAEEKPTKTIWPRVSPEAILQATAVQELRLALRPPERLVQCALPLSALRPSARNGIKRLVIPFATWLERRW